MPEPITLMDDETASQSPRSRSNSLDANDTFTFHRAQVTDCTVVNGENGSKFAVWKVSLAMQPCQGPETYHPSIVIYKRYSDFYRFRELLVRQCQESQLSTVDIPRLPSRVKWYESWRYQDVNLNKVWLAKRRQGLDYFLNKVLLNHQLVAANRELVTEFLDRQPEVNGC